MRLTMKGKHTLIVVLTMAGCAIGMLTALILSALQGTTGQKDTMILAGSRAQKAASAVAASRQITTPQWLYYQSSAKDRQEVKKELDRLVNQWTKDRLSDDELGEQMTLYLQKKGYEISHVGIQSRALCLFSSADALPDYTQMLAETSQIYDFIGVYTDGEYDENGRILCYYWEAGVKEK